MRFERQRAKDTLKNKKPATIAITGFSYGRGSRDRTRDLRFWRPPLYLAELYPFIVERWKLKV